MSAAWFSYPLAFESSREFECDDLTPEQCEWYKQTWHYWYEADHVYALSTVAFFVAVIGVFFIGHALAQIFNLTAIKPSQPLQRLRAGLRYLSYRGFRVEKLKWNSAPIGVLLLALVGTIFFFLITLIPQPYYWPLEEFGHSPPLGTRAGWLALACMPFLFATASKANWITLVTGVSHEKLQVFHRWIAYAFFILALVHTFPFIVYHTYWGDLHQLVTQDDTFVYWTGIAALIFQAWLTFASFSTIRNLGYEFFKIMHFAAVVVFIIIFFWHCGGALTSWDYFVATAAVYVPSVVYPWLRTIFEYGIGQKAYLHLEDNDFVRITIPTKSRWVPGQHCFLRFTGFGVHALTAHPFTICSLPPVSANDSSELVFYVRRRGGLTARLHKLAESSPGGAVSVLVDGPYGGVDTSRLFASERLVVVAGGSGAGWILPFIELFARRNATVGQHEKSSDAQPNVDNEESGLISNTTGLLSLRVVLATRETQTRTWFLGAVQNVLSRYTTQPDFAGVRVEVHLTGDAQQTLQSDDSSNNSIVENKADASNHIKTKPIAADQSGGRPNLAAIVAEEAASTTDSKQSLGVFVCGPLEMQNDVRNAVARENLAVFKGSPSRGVYLHLEHFSWA